MPLECNAPLSLTNGGPSACSLVPSSIHFSTIRGFCLFFVVVMVLMFIAALSAKVVIDNSLNMNQR